MSTGGLASRLGVAAAVVLSVLAFTVPSAGAAETVLNPGPIEATFEGGSMNVGGILQIPFAPQSPVTARGGIADDGTLELPTSSVLFPPVVATVPFPAHGTSFRLQVVATAVSGTLNPSTGRANIDVNVRVDVTIGGSTTCSIGTDAAPIPIKLTTDGAGQPYDPSDGSIVLFSDNWPVPGLSNCSGPLAGSLGILSAPVLAQAGASSLTLRGYITRADTRAFIAPATRCTVPKLKGKTLAAARTLIKQAFCKPGKVTRRASSKKRNVVLNSTPKAGATLPAGTVVDLVVSKGPAKKKRR